MPALLLVHLLTTEGLSRGPAYSCRRVEASCQRLTRTVRYGSLTSRAGSTLVLTMTLRRCSERMVLMPRLSTSLSSSLASTSSPADDPMGISSELINAIASVRPVLRRQLGGAWDLAYNWMALEPHVHHIALPGLVLLAMLATCLVWGWTREAGLFALMWGGLCRPGEVVAAYRRHLVLPADVLGSQAFALLRIEEPKTRRRAARHQAAKVDLPDLLEVLVVAFGALEPTQKLWPFSGQTLRARFQRVCDTLRLPDGNKAGRKGLELGSFRPGGATWLLQSSESPDLVRRRGRWLSPRIMDINLQEVEAATFLADQAPEVRLRVHSIASTFSTVLQKISLWHRAKIPSNLWYWLCKSNETEGRRAGNAGRAGEC